MKTKIIILLIITASLFCRNSWGQFRATYVNTTTDSIAVKIVVPTDLFSNKSKLIIQNKHTSAILVRLYCNKFNSRTAEDWAETYLTVRTQNRETGKMEYEGRTLIPIESEGGSGGVNGTREKIEAGSSIELSVNLRYEDINPAKYDILDSYANLIYIKFSDYRVSSDFIHTQIRPIEIEFSGITTPCCTPQPGGTLTAEEAKKKKIVKAEFLSLDECDNRLAYADSANHVDTTKISTLFYLAKNSFYTWSLMLRDQYEIYPNNASLVARYSKYPLKIGVANFKNYYKGLYPSATQSFQTVPLSPYGHYKFTAPSGYDFYSSMKNYYSNYSRLLTEAYFVAYDGSVYCIFISNKNLCNANLHYLNNSFFYSKTSEQLSIRWGFLDGGRMQDEFLDAFIRLYDEGSHFSKEDAYNAAFAYIMEGRGVELYRRAPNETEFKCYNTTPFYEAGSNKISGFNATIK